MFLRQWWTVGAWRQVGAGMIMIRRNASTIWSAQGQRPGSRRYRRRLLRMRRAGTCSIRNRSALGSAAAMSLSRASSRSQAVRSAATATICSQAWLMAYSRDGNRPRPVSLAALIRSSTRAWARCRASKNANCPARVLVGEGLVAPTVSLLQRRQLRAGVGTFPADDDPHPGRPASQIQQPGDLGDLSALADLTVSGDRRRPPPLRNGGDGAGQRRVLGGEADRVLQPAAADLGWTGQPVQQFMGGAGPVGTNQQVPAMTGRDLGDRPAQHIDVVPGVVAAGVTRPQADRQQLGGNRRSPPRLMRWRTVFPDEAGMGFTPARLAKAASDRTRPGWDHAARATAAVTGPMPGWSRSLRAGLSLRSAVICLALAASSWSAARTRFASRTASARATLGASASSRVRHAATVAMWPPVSALRASIPRSATRSKAVNALIAAVRSALR